ncbi:beta family protein [Saccharothrix sp. Mg75]|uniref:beta family protein n=1 Tax=Saccharothrix sp. Mg75 TaxID=3445357 RepID=UPI003EEEFDB5
MPFTPLIALKSKKGELDALHHLPANPESRPAILVELLDSVGVAERGQLLPALVRAAVDAAAHDKPLWIDAHLLSATSSLARQPGGPLEFLDKQIENTLHDELGLLALDVTALIPVVADSATDDELRTISLLRQHRPRDVVVRVRGVATPPAEIVDRLRRVVSRTGVEAGHLHAVIDLGFVETVQPAHVARAARLIGTIVEGIGPSSTTLLAGSIPAGRNSFATTTRQRPEVPLWLAVAEQVGRAVNYGDYGVVHPVPPEGGDPGPRTVNPYLYYTAPGSTVALRRQLAREDGKPVQGAAVEAFTALAEELLARPEFAGRDFSWGDHELTRCRRGGGRTAGTVPRWIAIATSHHIEHVTRRAPSDL